MIITNAHKVILYLSNVVNGSVHDYQLFKNKFGRDKEIFKNNTLCLDLGYQGIATDYTVDNLDTNAW